MNSIKVVVLCLVIGLALQQVPVVTSCSPTDTVTNKNTAVLKWLTTNSVALEQTASKTGETGVCGTEFTTHGSCCNIASLKTFFQKSNDKLVGKWTSYITKLGRINGKFLGGFNKMLAKANVKDVNNKMTEIKADGTKAASSFGKAEALRPKADDDIAAMKTYFAGFADQIKTFKIDGKKCYDAMKKIRGNLMCAACSARATMFTDSQSDTAAVYRVDQNSCNSLVAACYSTWKLNFMLTTMMQYSAIVLAKKKTAAAGFTLKSEKDVVNSDLESLKAIFKSCSFAKADDKVFTCTDVSKTHQEWSNMLCSKAFSVNNQNAYVEGDESIDSNVTDDDIATADASITTPARLLQAAPVASFDLGIVVAPAAAPEAVFPSANADGNTLIPATSVTTSAAGDASSTSSYAGLITTVTAVFAAWVALL